jgi:hypothetical protein
MCTFVLTCAHPKRHRDRSPIQKLLRTKHAQPRSSLQLGFRKRWYILMICVFILSIILNLEPGCHNSPLRRSTSSSVNPKPEMSPLLGHIYMSSTGIYVPYILLATYVIYLVPSIGPTCHAYIPTFSTRTLLYPSQLAPTLP